MKVSKYNFFKKYDNTIIFFNAMTCALAVVDNSFLQVIKDIKNKCYDEKKYDKDLLNNMKLSGAIIDDDVNELKLINFYRNIGKYDTTTLALTIAPTLACNFRCKYCFENHNTGVMNSDNQNALIEFISAHMANIRNLSITWYGGEPLIAKSIIYSLSKKILELCNENNIEYNAFIITNASLLTDDDIIAFKNYHIKGAQVTIDGPQKIHDKRRISCNGKSTFNLLINNIDKLLNNDLDVILRINVDKENVNSLDELLNIIKKRILKYQKLRIDFGKVSMFTEICKSIENNCFDNEQYADILLPLYKKVIDMGFVMNKMTVYPHIRYNYCCTDYINSFVIDVEGYMYKCWNHVGDKVYSCAHLTDKDKKPLVKYLNWIEWNPLLIDKCKKCNMLPICMGGCPDAARKNVNNMPVCDTVKYNLEKILEFYYEKLKGEI
ncbi:radical SAM protein [Megamonas hypermegale]|uniref:radical SAM/SPASM domain-containing protein n=1 Tax=Megamonas hypermegale TaxID=158847 RepID=UPI0026EE2685|nr:radical SAM protein [Megamonas hypermegale]